MFWDGTRWIDQRARRRAPTPQPRRMRDWLATGIIIFATAALAFPLIHVEADARALSLTPVGGRVGTRVTLQAQALPPGTAFQVTWDGSAAGMPRGIVSWKGQARVRFTVPATSPGQHSVAVMTSTPAGGWTRRSRLGSVLPVGLVLATAAFSVTPGTASTTPPTPSQSPIVSVSPSPTQSSTAALAPSPTPTAPTVAAPAQLATPVPTAAPTPKPPVPPAPTPVPTPAPVAGCARLVNVDASGATDVTAALQSFLNASPNGSTVCFAPAGQYRVDGMLSLDNRTGLTLDGQGARMFGTVRTNSPKLRFQLGSDLVVRNLTIEGFNPDAGTSNAHVLSWEGGHGIAIYGSQRVTLAPNVTMRNLSGDGIYITGGFVSGGGFRWADGVTVTGCRIERNGRQGVALTDGARNIVVSGCVLDKIALYAFDIEPNGHVFSGIAAGAENVRFSDNAVGTYGIDPDFTPLLFAGTGNGPQRNIEFSRNVVTGGALLIGAWNVAGSGRNDFRILDNRSTVRVAGPAMDFSGVNTLVVTGNTQPLSSGSLMTTSSCTNVVIANNITQ